MGERYWKVRVDVWTKDKPSSNPKRRVFSVLCLAKDDAEASELAKKCASKQIFGPLIVGTETPEIATTELPYVLKTIAGPFRKPRNVEGRHG